MSEKLSNAKIIKLICTGKDPRLLATVKKSHLQELVRKEGIVGIKKDASKRQLIKTICSIYGNQGLGSEKEIARKTAKILKNSLPSDIIDVFFPKETKIWKGIKMKSNKEIQTIAKGMFAERGLTKPEKIPRDILVQLITQGIDNTFRSRYMVGVDVFEDFINDRRREGEPYRTALGMMQESMHDMHRQIYYLYFALFAGYDEIVPEYRLKQYPEFSKALTNVGFTEQTVEDAITYFEGVIPKNMTFALREALRNGGMLKSSYLTNHTFLDDQTLNIFDVSSRLIPVILLLSDECVIGGTITISSAFSYYNEDGRFNDKEEKAAEMMFTDVLGNRSYGVKDGVEHMMNTIEKVKETCNTTTVAFSFMLHTHAMMLISHNDDILITDPGNTDDNIWDGLIGDKDGNGQPFMLENRELLGRLCKELNTKYGKEIYLNSPYTYDYGVEGKTTLSHYQYTYCPVNTYWTSLGEIYSQDGTAMIIPGGRCVIYSAIYVAIVSTYGYVDGDRRFKQFMGEDKVYSELTHDQMTYMREIFAHLISIYSLEIVFSKFF